MSDRVELFAGDIPEKLLALTVLNPYAEQIRLLEKPIENRPRRHHVRGIVAIHAGKSRSWLESDDDQSYPGMAFGAIVAVARCVDCLYKPNSIEGVGVRTSAFANWPVAYQPLFDHHTAIGPWCLILQDVTPLRIPIEARGYQGWWIVERPQRDEIRRQLSITGMAVN